VALTTILLTAAVFSISRATSAAARESSLTLRCDYLAQAALNRAFSEITTETDPTGEGLGAMGVATPVDFYDALGNKVGEYRTAVTSQTNGIVTVLSVAAVPSFQDPLYTRAVDGIISATPQFLLAPEPAAVSIAGPLADPEFPSMGSGTLLIDGGDNAAFSFSNAGAYQKVMDILGDKVYYGNLDGSELDGAQTSTYAHATAGSITLPVVQEDEAFLTSQALDDYRVELRTQVLNLADGADQVITASVNGNRNWGTAASPQVTVIESAQIGSTAVFNTNNQTVTGYGTLIIKHTCKPQKNLNLTWNGDIFVLGFDGDGSDLFKVGGLQGTINGNLILLASDDTEASLELENSSARGSDLTVNGSLLCFAEALSHEAEVEAESSSKLTVNGMLGLYGSRIELQASGSSSQLNVTGALAMGMAQDLEEAPFRTDDFEFQMAGSVSIVYDEDVLRDAVDGLSGLQTSLGVDSSSAGVGGYSYNLIGASGGISAAAAAAEIDALFQTYGAGYDYGLDPAELASGS
jgi:hypothetical protein